MAKARLKICAPLADVTY